MTEGIARRIMAVLVEMAHTMYQSQDISARDKKDLAMAIRDLQQQIDFEYR